MPILYKCRDKGLVIASALLAASEALWREAIHVTEKN
jgi:hypothetical protein